MARPDRNRRLAIFSTHDVAADDRAEYWNGILTRYFGPMETLATRRSTFKATLAARPVSFLRTFHIVGSGHKVQRAKSNAGIVPDAIKLLLQIRGRCRVDQEGRTAELRPGSWCVYDTWRPYGLTNLGDIEQIVIQIPRDQIIDRSFQQLTEPFLADPDRSAMAQIAASFIRSYADPKLTPEDGDEFLAATTVGLVRHVLHSDVSQRGSAQTTSCLLRSRIRQYILAHLNNPDLTIDRIALAMGCSKRYLHQVFAAENLTIERYIWRLRIEQCHEALADREQLQKSVSTIAFEWGFNSSAHFSRLFKSQVGLAPTSFRRGRSAARFPNKPEGKVGLMA
ncbi:MAG TPA: helix-turn-helix domain-containing protein [Xanthobacteraceae bacterium]|nr:helix-turn-helix domain-containing protein [Xanthobacteraceae bacterium]